MTKKRSLKKEICTAKKDPPPVSLMKQVKRIKIKRSDASTKRFSTKVEKQVLLTETVCMQDQIVLFVETSISKFGGKAKILQPTL